jgi:hypothetical protein
MKEEVGLLHLPGKAAGRTIQTSLSSHKEVLE